MGAAKNKIHLCNTCANCEKIQIVKNNELMFSKENNLCWSVHFADKLKKQYNKEIEFPILISGVVSKCNYRKVLMDKIGDKTLEMNK